MDILIKIGLGTVFMIGMLTIYVFTVFTIGRLLGYV